LRKHFEWDVQMVKMIWTALFSVSPRTRRLVAISSVAAVAVGVAAAILILPNFGGESTVGAQPANCTSPVTSATQATQAVKVAESRVGFGAKVPKDVPPGSALVFIRCSTGPDEVKDGLRYIEFDYEGPQVNDLNGRATKSNWFVQQLAVRINQPTGESIGKVAGFDLYREVVSSRPTGEPFMVGYMALRGNETFVFTFWGNPPSDGELKSLLTSIP
jgi:hypothetical protein